MVALRTNGGYMVKKAEKNLAKSAVADFSLIDENLLKSRIYTIRGVKVMLDADLAEIYGYSTKDFNRQAIFRCSYPGKAHFFFQVNLLTMCIQLDTLMCMHKRLDIAEYLDNEEIVAEYLNLVSESDDPALFLRAIGHIARSKGMSQIAEKTGLGRESLYKALDEKAHPRFETIFKVLNAMGIQMTLVPKMKFRKRSKQTARCVAEKRARYKA